MWNEIELPDLSAVDWRTAATAMASDLRAMFGRHPWLVQAFGSQVFYRPGKARHDDHSLALYEGAGFSGVETGQAMARCSCSCWAAPWVSRPRFAGDGSSARRWQPG